MAQKLSRDHEGADSIPTHDPEGANNNPSRDREGAEKERGRERELVARGLVPRQRPLDSQSQAHSQQRWNRKRIRLPPAIYAHPGLICSITIVVANRQPVFTDPAVAEAAVEVLRAHAARMDVQVFAYCIMPEHVHLVLSPSPVCDITTFVGQFKNLAQRAAWKLGVKGTFWQKSFWDHVLRADEQLERLVAYVLNNPVRRGLVVDWRDYPYVGSLESEL